MAERGLERNRIIAELTRSPHGKLDEYVPVVKAASAEHPEFLAHLVAWNNRKGQVRDSKVALPVASLLHAGLHPEFIDNALAHWAMLNPREFLRAYRFSLDLKLPHRSRGKRLVAAYLAHKERNIPKWDRTAIQHRRVLKELYALAHVKPSDRANEILFKQRYPEGSLFSTVAALKDMSPTEAAGTIMERGLPFLVCVGALGAKAKEPDLVLALIQRMSPTELVTNTKMLERLGVKTNPALRGEFQKALGRASTSGANLLKTTAAVDAIDDEDLKQTMRGLQDKQIAKFSGVEGNWLVLADRSPSMEQAVELAKQVAATLVAMCKGKVTLTFFDTQPQTIDVTGASLDVIQKATRHITAGGSGTSIGCGLQRAMDAGEDYDGIAIVSDAQENSAPLFANVYPKYSAKVGKEVPVYLYHCGCKDPTLGRLMANSGLDMQVFDLPAKTDYYALPNLVSTMRTNRYSLVDEIMAMPLAKLSDVIHERAEGIVPGVEGRNHAVSAS